MEYTTIRQFAEDQHVSYEAIRRQLGVYRKELEGHIIKKNQMKLLDEYAVEFLRQRRKQSPVVVINQEREETIDQLKDELLRSKDQIARLQEKIGAMRDEINEIKDREREAIATEARYQLALESIKQKNEEIGQRKAAEEEAKEEARAARLALTAEREQLYQARADLTVAEAERERLQLETSKYHRTLFGLYRRVE